ncbi:lysoplasmalogenase [Streptomyces sp. NPDC052051]|uniref:lysoplasmalogenase n=1 Tax=Streptomyces sp. NPDC052051 TaxID=3154649 RepID=UPI0034462713
MTLGAERLVDRRAPQRSERLARVFLVLFWCAVVADLGCLAADLSLGHTLAKPLLMPLLALHVIVRGGPRLQVAALLFGCGGDVLLLLDADPAFLAGMASFAAGHVCYLLLFRRQSAPRARAAWTAGVYGIVLVALVVLLWPGLPAGLRIPVAGYSLLLTAMACGSTRLGPVAGVGGALFLLSDTLIATGIADWPQLPRPDLWIMLTYDLAQFLLTLGLLAVRGTPAATEQREVSTVTS